MALPRLFPRLRGGLQTKDLAPAGAEQKVILSSYYAALAGSGITLRGQDRGRGWAVERAVAEGYERVVWCFKPVQVIAGNSAALPFRLKDGENEVTEHPLYKVLNKQANPLETANVFRKRLSAQVLLSRRGAFVEVTKTNGGGIERIDLLPPGRTRPVPGTGSDPISHFEVTPLGGGEPRTVDTDKVRWVRDPHPIDPYGAITPLEAAGLSIELDYFARLYNVSFMANDGRPGGILGVKPPENGGGEMDAEEMDRLEARFGRGPVEAGKLSVLSGELSYVDVAARPRDMQYQATSKNAKTEMLVAFGVPESQLGNAADRTFANAEEEGYSFWTQTMEMHNAIILSAFEQDSEDDLTGFFDTSKIEVLQRPAIARRVEAREEVAAGLRSIFSYMVLAGTEDEVEETPFTRALWLPAGKTPIPAREEDAEALGVGAVAPEEEGLAPEVDPNAAPAAPGEEIGPGGVPADPNAPVASTGAASAPTPVSGPANRPAASPASRSGGGDLSLFGDASFASHPRPPRRQVHLAAVREHKAASDDLESALDESLAEQTEADVAEALAAITERQVERAIARLKSPRERKGTRHFVAEFEIDTRVGTKALDAPRIAGEGDEPDGETDAVRRILERSGATAASGLLADLTSKAGGLPTNLLRRVKTTVGDAMRLVNDSVRLQRQRIADTINRLDQAGKSVEEIVAALRALQDNWSEGLAIQATTATLEGARADAADSLSEEERADIVRVWRSKRDTKVRVTHQKPTKDNPGGADGQQRGMGEPFIVGTSLMRYPGDPSAPPKETANCRCRLVYRSKSTGRFRAAPEAKHLPGRHDQGVHGNLYRKVPVKAPARARTAAQPSTGSVGPGKAPAKAKAPVKATATDVPDGLEEVEPQYTRELIRKGRARVYEIPPPVVGRKDRVRESDIEDADEAALREQERERLVDDWQDVPPDVTPEDIEAWRGDWVDEFPEYAEDEDPEAYAALDDAFMANWGKEWISRPWSMEGVPAEKIEVEQAKIKPLRTKAQEVEEAYELYVENAMLEAEKATKGALFSREGQRLDIAEVTLFKGRLSRKYASEELLEWWETNPRLTRTEFKRQWSRDDEQGESEAEEERAAQRRARREAARAK